MIIHEDNEPSTKHEAQHLIEELAQLTERAKVIIEHLSGGVIMPRAVDKFLFPPDIVRLPTYIERTAMPEARWVRRMIHNRNLRAVYFGEGLFADPAWDMLIDLVAASGEGKRVSVTSLCLASGVPSTTALRWITLLNDAGLIDRTDDDLDRRRSFISLTMKARRLLAQYFEHCKSGRAPQ